MTNLVVTEFVAGGAFGKVYLVRQAGKDAEAPMAVKIVSRQNGSSPEDRLATSIAERSLALEEKILLANEKGSFLASAFAVIHTDDHLYFVMPFYGGGDLLSLMRRHGRPDAYTARLYIAELVLAVCQLHMAGYLHRDIKLENIMLDNDGHVVLGDFGLSVETLPSLDDPFCQKCCGELAGTPVYFAPEQLCGEWFGQPADWWAVGVVAYQLLTGRHPFEGPGGRDQLNQRIVCSDIRLHYRDIGVRLDYSTGVFLSRLLTKDPSQRLGSGPDGMTDLFRDPFFDGLNWSKVMDKLIPFPFPGLGKDDV